MPTSVAMLGSSIIWPTMVVSLARVSALSLPSPPTVSFHPHQLPVLALLGRPAYVISKWAADIIAQPTVHAGAGGGGGFVGYGVEAYNFDF